jgi:hypothetical protein
MLAMAPTNVPLQIMQMHGRDAPAQTLMFQILLMLVGAKEGQCLGAAKMLHNGWELADSNRTGAARAASIFSSCQRSEYPKTARFTDILSTHNPTLQVLADF